MIIIRLKGGLGNQMFQYALGRVLSLKNNDQFKVDLSFLNFTYKGITKRSYDLDVFNLKIDFSRDNEIPIIHKLNKSKYFFYLMTFFKKIFKIKGQENSFSFDNRILNLKGDIFLDGYWQSPKYFNDYTDIIRQDFVFKDVFNNKVKTLVQEIKNCKSLCVHVRRGDFLNNNNHNVLKDDFYDICFKKLKDMGNLPDKIYVFSDDINWCKENMNFEDIPTFFSTKEYAGKKGEGDLFLMSNCKYFIIPNSTFSWWGAWLSNREGKVVVCPQKWFADNNMNTKDLLPEEWIKI